MTRLTSVRIRLEAWKNRSLLWSSVFVVAAGVAYCISLGSRIRFPDERDYLRLAENLSQHGIYSLDGVHSTAFRPPGYPLLLGLLRDLGASVTVLRALNVAFLVVVVWGAWWLAGRVGGPAAATIAAPIAAVYPIGFYTMGSLYPQTMGAALLMAGLVAVVSLRGSARPWPRAVGAGAAFSALIVTIPTFALVLVIGAIWLLIKDRRIGPVLVIVALAAVLPVAWSIRSTAAMDSFVPASTNNGLNLLLGNSQHAGARTGAITDIDSYRREVRQRGLDEVETDTFYRNAALDWIRANPGRATVLFVEKTVNYFAPFDQLATDAESSVAEEVIAVLTYWPLLALFLWRLILWRRDRPGDIEKLLILVYLISAPAQAVFFTRVRFRMPLDYVLIVVVAAFLAYLLGKRTGGNPDGYRPDALRRDSMSTTEAVPSTSGAAVGSPAGGVTSR